MFASSKFPFDAELGLRYRKLLFRWSVGTRLMALMALAAVIGIGLTVSGMRGMAGTAAELQRLHDERMVPVRTLSRVSQLMLANQYQLQLLLAQARQPQDPAESTARSGQFDFEASAAAVTQSARNITRLWDDYRTTLPAQGDETSLAERFAQQRAAYLREGIVPALEALRERRLDRVVERARQTHDLYQQADAELQSLIDMQFARARSAYEQGMEQYRGTRNRALATLLLAVVLLTLLGWGQILAITLPLRIARTVFKQIADGHFNNPIPMLGRDEISSFLRDLSALQARLADNQREIDHLIHYDQLTGLPNRRLLRERVTQALRSSSEHEGERALLLLDLDHFKAINDTLGHEIGDAYLQEMAERLRSAASPRHFAARIGGDEFVVLSGPLDINPDAALAQAENLAREILERLAQPWQTRGQLRHGSASIGVCLFSAGQVTVTDLLKHADLAMYEAKNSGRGRWCVFDPPMQTRMEYRAALSAALHDAIKLNQLAVHLQPLVNVHGRVIGAETLLRWTHPIHGQVPPQIFITLAEANGAIVPIGSWVLEQACHLLARWQQTPAMRSLRLSVNVSIRQFKQVDFVAQLVRLLDATKIDASLLVLELTEGLVVDDIDDTVAKMTVLHRRGVRFALDDFGTGYSSLSLLRRLPLDVLKIDRTFVRDIASDSGSATLVHTIITLAQNLGLQTIAEGVESDDQFAALQTQGCRFFQGYLFSRPMPLAQFSSWLGDYAPTTQPTEALPGDSTRWPTHALPA